MNSGHIAPSDQDYDLFRVLAALRRFWWVVIAIPMAILLVLTIRNVTAAYQSEFRASILIPGDTEIPGSAERPEIMVLDDLPSVIESSAFAELVATAAGMSVADVEGTLTAERYSRIATVRASSDSKLKAEQLALAAADSLPSGVNQFMVPAGGVEATVIVIDRPSSAFRGEADKWSIAAIATAVGLAIGCFVALICDASVTGLRQVSGRNRPE